MLRTKFTSIYIWLMSKREVTSQLLGDVMFRGLTDDLTGRDLTPDRVLEAGPKRGERDGKILTPFYETYWVGKGSFTNCLCDTWPNLLATQTDGLQAPCAQCWSCREERDGKSVYISARLDSLKWPVVTSSSRSRGRSCEHSP